MPGAAGGRRHVRSALLVSLVAGVSLAVALELLLLAEFGRPARAGTAFALAALTTGAVGLLSAALLRRHEERIWLHAEWLRLIGDPTLDALDDEDMLSIMAGRLRDVMSADQVAVLFRTVEDGLRLAAGAGLEGYRADTIDFGRLSASPAGSCQPLLAAPGGGGTAWVEPISAVPTKSGGLVYVGWNAGCQVSDDDQRILKLAADRVWLVLHRRRLIDGERRARFNSEGARRQLAVLADAGRAFAPILDSYEEGVTALADVCVPAFADLCVIDVMDDDGQLATVVSRINPASELAAPAGTSWRALLHQVQVDGRTRFEFIGNEQGAGGGPTDLLAKHLQATSALIVPVQAGGLSLGTITMATGAGRRGFRTSDVAVAEDVARRLGLSLQRVLLYRQLQTSAAAHASSAGRLRRLTDAAIVLAASGGPDHLVDEAAAEAQQVMRTAATLVVHRPVDQPERRGIRGEVDEPTRAVLTFVATSAIDSGTRTDQDRCHAVPLLDSEQICRGALAVVAHPDRPLDADDDAALVSLAHLVALVLARTELTTALAAREARLQAIVDAAPLAIVRLSPDGEVQGGNRSAAELFAWPAGSSVGPLPEAVADDLLQLTAVAARGEQTGDASVEWKGTDGQVVDLNVAAAPVRNDLGQVKMVLLLVADVSVRRRAERHLQLAQRLDAMGQLAGGVAHDFNNLLTVIVGYTEALLAAVDPGDPTRPLLESIERAGASAAALTRRLLGLAGQRAIEPVPVVPKRLMDDLEPVVRRLMGADVEVVLQVAPTPNVMADPAELERLFLNLAINARDAMPLGGRLTLSVTVTALDQTEAETRRLQPGSYVVFSVTDTGTGMDDETKARCFEPFFTTKEGGRGTGLGLAGVYSVAQEAGGAVDVTSRPGGGTTFRVWLPCSDRQPCVAASVAAPASPSPGGRILLVEDEEEIRELTRHLLEDNGYAVVTAADGFDAIRAFEQRTGPFAVLVTDIVMPGLRGPELAGRLQAMQPSLQVLYVSGYTGAADQTALINEKKVLGKPFRSSELLARIGHLAQISGTYKTGDAGSDGSDGSDGSNR